MGLCLSLNGDLLCFMGRDGTFTRWISLIFFGSEMGLERTVLGLHVGSPRTEIAPSPSRKMLGTNVKYGRIMENTGKHTGKASSSHLLRILETGYKEGLWEPPRRTLIFPSSVQTRRPRDPENIRTAEVGCGWLLGNTEIWIELSNDNDNEFDLETNQTKQNSGFVKQQRGLFQHKSRVHHRQ